MKKLLMVVSQLATGGTEVLTTLLANSFSQKNGIKCAILNIKPKDSEILPLFSPHVDVVMAEGKVLNKILFIRNFYKKFAPEYIICQSILSYLIIRLALIWKDRVKIFLSLHYTVKYGIRDSLMAYLVFKFIEHSQDEIILSYQSQKELFVKRYKIPEFKFNHVYNGIKIPSTRNKKKYSNDGVLRIIHVGNYRREKDQLTLLKSLAILNKRKKEWRASLRGLFPENIKLEFKEYLKSNSIEEKVDFIEYASDIMSLYSQYDIFVLSSVSEALPMSAIEASCMGLPCILTDVGGCSEIVDDNITGLIIPPNEPETLANGIEFFIDNPDKLQEFGEAAQKKVEKLFNIDNNSKQYLRIFEGK